MVAAITKAMTQMITRRRSSPRCSPSVMLSGDGRFFRLPVKGSVTTVVSFSSGSGRRERPRRTAGGPVAGVRRGSVPVPVPVRSGACRWRRLRPLLARAGPQQGMLPQPATPAPAAAAAVPFSDGSVGGWNEPSGASSEDMFERWLSSADGERASRAISEVGGRSGMVLRTSDSIRCRNSLKERQAPPSWRATWGRRSGPRRMMATTPITSSLPGSRFNMCLHSTVQLQGLDESLHPFVV